jgi:hypothetical protein
MGVGAYLRRDFRAQQIEKRIELLGRIAGQIDKLLVRSLDCRPKPPFHVVRGLRCCFQESNGSCKGRCYRIKQFSDHGTTRAALESGKALNNGMRLRLKGDLDTRFDGRHDGSRWTLMGEVWP